jgi:Tol biopolymer transport system component
MDRPAPSLVGRELGPYRVLSRIAAGGMGEVFLARDEKLGRDVAIKTLPATFLHDADRLARFEREARVLASLNHPHIAAIYGFLEQESVRALVLELVAGPTVAERLRGGALPLGTALTIARQIAAALEAAHERGIVHRDLKPANIKLTADGAVKVLDFGIAKMIAPDPADGEDAETAAPIAGATRAGAMIGTPGYMSPEQLRGQSVDRRTDIWAFGCVLFEMLTGRSAFGGGSDSDAIAAVLEREPDWAQLPESTPATVHRLLRRCLQKDPKERLRDAGDVRIAIEDALVESPVRLRTAVQRTRPALIVAAALLIVAIVGIWLWRRGATATNDDAAAVTRATVSLPALQELDTGDGAYPLAIAPDGRCVVYGASVRGGPVHLYVRDLGAFEPRLLAGTPGAQHPFFSPDGHAVGFFADGKLKRVALAGGSPVPVCDVPPLADHGAWSVDGSIVFDPGASGLLGVPATGGVPQPVETGDAALQARDLGDPHFLPGGRTLLLTVLLDDGPRIAAVSLDTGRWHLLVRGRQPAFVPPAYLVFHADSVREGELHAVELDLEQLTLKGDAFAVLDSVFRAPAGGSAYFAIAGNGTLVFAPGGLAHALVRVDRGGRRVPLTEERRGFRFPRLSPDGQQVAITIDPRPSQLWMYDIGRSSRRPLSVNGHNIGGAWRPDGLRYAYYSKGDIYWRASDASDREERLLERDRNQYPSTWTPDGSRLLFTDDHAVTRSDIWALTPGGAATPYIVTPAREDNPRLSADGRWLAYTSDESGQPEVHVRPFPDVHRGKWVVSSGGHSPVWARSGRELFYRNGNTLMRVPVDPRGMQLSAGPPEALFSGPFDSTQGSNVDVSPDGSYFVMVEADPDQRPTRLQLVLNWRDEIERAARATGSGR